jgi:hypothetical protein
MVTNSLVTVQRSGAFALKYLNPALKVLKKNWKGVMGQAGIAGGSAYLGSTFTDDELGTLLEGEIGHQLSADEKAYAVQTLKDAADDTNSDEIFTPFSKRLNEYIEPTHLVIDLHSKKSWYTNNYVSPNYVKAIKRNTVSRSSSYRRKR